MLRDATLTWDVASVDVLSPPRPIAAAAEGRRASRRAPLALAAAGLVVSLVATGLTMSVASDQPADRGLAEPAAPVVAVAPAPAPGRIVLNGPGDVAVVTVVYEVGQSSGWHAHAGLHAIAVLSGELTVYNEACTPMRIVAGQPYVGGQDLHMARNETGKPVEMIVTYLNPATATGDPGPRAAPAACAVTGRA